jgi:hypothetical protein
MRRSPQSLAALSLLPVLAALPARAQEVSLLSPEKPLEAGEVFVLKPILEGVSPADLAKGLCYRYSLRDLTGQCLKYHWVERADGSAEFRAPAAAAGTGR